MSVAPDSYGPRSSRGLVPRTERLRAWYAYGKKTSLPVQPMSLEELEHLFLAGD